ncbi:unnamed protein product [Mytilus edulis]|uniref:Uncharacterized protein n=1 Tax=Mytilus edulis TaxID=6550 RepID=A0A8S3SJB6_MYTED|nr:unnamed protein product [Mytilus edulis]
MAVNVLFQPPVVRRERHFRGFDPLEREFSDEELRQRYRFGRETIGYLSDLMRGSGAWDKEGDSPFSGTTGHDCFEVLWKKNRKVEIAPTKFEKIKRVESVLSKKPKLWPSIHEEIAKIVNQGSESTVDHRSKEVQELLEKYVRPENCDYLEVPKVNKVLWTSKETDKRLKDSDRNFQRTQGYLVNGMIPLVLLMDKSLKSSTEESEENFELALDSLNMLLYAHRDMSSQRKRLLTPALDKKYYVLSNEGEKISSKYLFGEQEDLEKRMKEIDDSVKLGKKIGYTKGFGKDKTREPEKSNRDNNKSNGQTGPDQPRGKEKQERQGKSGPQETLVTKDNVSTFMVNELHHLKNLPANFVAGKISNCLPVWKNITSDINLLSIVSQGYHLEFETEPCNKCSRKEIKFNDTEQLIIDDLLSNLLNKSVIEFTNHQFGEVVSHIFIRPKPDGSHRLILNLSNLNEHLEYKHFKMETFKSAVELYNNELKTEDEATQCMCTDSTFKNRPANQPTVRSIVEHTIKSEVMETAKLNLDCDLKLDYGSIVYGSARKSYIQILDAVHHQGLRFCLGAFKNSPVESLYVEADEHSLSDRRLKLGLQYNVKLKAYSDNPAYSCVFNPIYEDIFAKHENKIPPLGIRLNHI